MNGDIQNPECFHTHVVPEQYLPYTCTELTSKHIEFAKKYLNETEETRKKALRRLRRFIKGELDVFSEMDDTFLLSFLRAKKFNFKETCLMMKNAVEFIEINRDYLNKIDTEKIRRVIESKAIMLLPYRDAKGRAIFLLIAENWDPTDLTPEDMIFGMIVALNTVVENPVNQVTGCVVILDFKGVYFSQFREASSWFLFCVQNLQNCCSLIIQEIHILHTPSLVLLGWSIIKPFLYEYALKIIYFYDSSNWESLYEKIPPCILPEEIGGHLGPYSFEHLTDDIPTIRKKFFDKFHRCLED